MNCRDCGEPTRWIATEDEDYPHCWAQYCEICERSRRIDDAEKQGVPHCPDGCHWDEMRDNGIGELGDVWLEYRTCWHGYTYTQEVPQPSEGDEPSAPADSAAKDVA